MKKIERKSSNCIEVTGKVYNTFAGNRELNQAHVTAIYKAIKEGKVMPPILVDRESQICTDGQHRMAAYQRLWREGDETPMSVFFVECSNPVYEAVTFNNTAPRWNMGTYIKAYTQCGNPEVEKEYRSFKDFTESHPVFTGLRGGYVWTAALALIGISAEHVKRASLKMPADMDTIEQICNEYQNLAACGDFIARRYSVAGWNNVRSLILKRISFEDYLNAFKMTFVHPASTNMYAWGEAFLKVLNK